MSRRALTAVLLTALLALAGCGQPEEASSPTNPDPVQPSDVVRDGLQGS